MAKWYNWLLNPVRTLIDTLNEDVSPSKWYENIPFVGDIVSGSDTDFQSERLRKQIENMASRAGMSLDEFLAANPRFKQMYDSPSDYVGINGTVNEVKEGSKSLLGIDLSEIMPALIHKLLGITDVAENEKNRQFQSEQAEISRQWEEEQAKAAREWDSIGAQMERAAGAGVNPISVAMQNGGINGAVSTSIPSAPSTPVGSAGLISNSPLDIASTVFGGIGTLAENRLKQSQSDDIVIMRKYNIAEKIANTDHLREMCKGVELSNVSQQIQNEWLDILNQATYDGMLLENGVRRESILRERSVTLLNLQQISSIKQDMQLTLERFNATLPLELQLSQEEINLKHASVQQVYTEISYRHLQAVEQENRNRQSSAEAGSAEVSELIARQTYEDAINAFHNDMVKGAADAGISLNDYLYYGASHVSVAQLPGAILNFHHHRLNENVRGMTDNNLRGIYP